MENNDRNKIQGFFINMLSFFFQRNPLERTQFFYVDFYLEIHFLPIGGHLKHLALLLNVTNHPGFSCRLQCKTPAYFLI